MVWAGVLAPILGALTAGAVYDVLLYSGEDSLVNRRRVDRLLPTLLVKEGLN